MLNTRLPPWFTKDGLDLSLYPIDNVLRQALSINSEEFRTACALLKSMCGAGRLEAGIFLLGLLRHYPNDYPRLTLIADSLESYPAIATVEAFASELCRVTGSSSTRGYLRRMIDALERFPIEITEELVESLAFDPRVGARFRQRLKSLLRGPNYE